MIKLVTTQRELFGNDGYEIVSVEESLRMFKDCKILQVDSETTGINAHLDELLCFQIGNDSLDARVVVDCNTVDIKRYKSLLEGKMLIGHNLKFDLQFLYKHGIIPRKVYDTMIVEQLLYLGYPSGQHSYSLKSVALDRIGIDIDKTVRGQIIWRGLDAEVITYAAGDVTYLERIMRSQVEECKRKDCLAGAKLECCSVPFMAYMEWCGIKLDAAKWKAKMDNDRRNLEESLRNLQDWCVKASESEYPFLKKYITIDRQGDLFNGFDLTPKVNINWSSPPQVIAVAKQLGFNTTTQDKKTGEDKDTVLEKVLMTQKGVCDEFLRLYYGKGSPGEDDYYPGYRGADKVVSSFGQGHLDAINPVTGRIHTNYHQLGASSGRMSCGSGTDPSLERYKKLPKGSCKMLNMQQLPHDAATRSCFVSEPTNLWVSVDFSAEEARLAGDIYNDQAIIDMFLKGLDSHSVYAKIFFKDELKDVDIKDVRKKRPDLRQKAKGPEFKHLS